jgi:hypothetical protein
MLALNWYHGLRVQPHTSREIVPAGDSFTLLGLCSEVAGHHRFIFVLQNYKSSSANVE